MYVLTFARSEKNTLKETHNLFSSTHIYAAKMEPYPRWDGGLDPSSFPLKFSWGSLCRHAPHILSSSPEPLLVFLDATWHFPSSSNCSCLYAIPYNWSLNNELFHRKIDLGIRASFSLPLQQPILVTCSAVRGKLARLLDVSETWSQWVGRRALGQKRGRMRGPFGGIMIVTLLIGRGKTA